MTVFRCKTVQLSEVRQQTVPGISSPAMPKAVMEIGAHLYIEKHTSKEAGISDKSAYGSNYQRGEYE